MISPTNSFFSVPPHYHPLTPEIFRVFSGEVIATIGGIRRTLRPEDGEITVERGVVHSFESPEGVHTEFAEREDGAEVMKKKAHFLMSAVQLGMGGANVSSIIREDASRLGGRWNCTNLMSSLGVLAWRNPGLQAFLGRWYVNP